MSACARPNVFCRHGQADVPGTSRAPGAKVRSSPARPSAMGHDAVDPCRRRDVLEDLLAEVVVDERQLALDLLVHFSRNQDAARIGHDSSRTSRDQKISGLPVAGPAKPPRATIQVCPGSFCALAIVFTNFRTGMRYGQAPHGRPALIVGSRTPAGVALFRFAPGSSDHYSPAQDRHSPVIRAIVRHWRD